VQAKFRNQNVMYSWLEAQFYVFCDFERLVYSF